MSHTHGILTAEEFDLVLELPGDLRAKFFDRALVASDPLVAAVAQGELVPSRYYPHCGHGAFAVVFRFRDVTSGRNYALRCLFQDPKVDASTRSSALQRYIASLPTPLPYLVEQRFYPNALSIRGARRSVFVMDWAEGLDLLSAVRGLVAAGDRERLRSLAAAIALMADDLQKFGMAHGDLQDGNLLVGPDSEVRLVDYDSFCIPELARRGALSPVAGTPGYTHPSYVIASAARPLQATNDTFATVVICLSLQALAAEPDLFAGDTTGRLVLSADDLAAPQSAPIWQRLQKSPDVATAELAQILHRWCSAPAMESEILIKDLARLRTLLRLTAAWPLWSPRPSQITVREQDLPALPKRWISRQLVSPQYVVSNAQAHLQHRKLFL